MKIEGLRIEQKITNSSFMDGCTKENSYQFFKKSANQEEDKNPLWVIKEESGFASRNCFDNLNRSLNIYL